MIRKGTSYRDRPPHEETLASRLFKASLGSDSIAFGMKELGCHAAIAKCGFDELRERLGTE